MIYSCKQSEQFYDLDKFQNYITQLVVPNICPLLRNIKVFFPILKNTPEVGPHTKFAAFRSVENKGNQKISYEDWRASMCKIFIDQSNLGFNPSTMCDIIFGNTSSFQVSIIFARSLDFIYIYIYISIFFM